MTSVEEIAWLIAFLCSSAANYVCGSVLDVNDDIYMN
jgi:3-oxoacyl-[acyl-carrier protein] reductase